jgi:hypothetical protein
VGGVFDVGDDLDAEATVERSRLLQDLEECARPVFQVVFCEVHIQQ